MKSFNKLLFLLLSISFIISLTGCGKNNNSVTASESKTGGTDSFSIYYLNSDSTGLLERPYIPKSHDTYTLAAELVKALAADPPELTLQKCIQNDDIVKSISYDGDKQITIDFTSMYTSDHEVTEVLKRAGIVKTLCQIPDVEYVVFTIEGQSLVLNGAEPVGRMTGDDFIDNTGGETTYHQNVQILLYYTDESGRKLKTSRHNVTFDGKISLEELAMDQLIDGPLPEEALKPVIPSGTKLNSVSLKDGLCIVDLSSEFLQSMENVSPDVTVYSIVNTLVELNGVSKVQITVDGNTVKKYREKVALSSPLERNLDIVAAD